MLSLLSCVRACVRVCARHIRSHCARSESGVLDRREFLSKMKRLFVMPGEDASVQLWYDCVRSQVLQTFDVLAGVDRELDVIEFEQWLRHKPKPKNADGSRGALDSHVDAEERVAAAAIKARGGYRKKAPTLSERLEEIARTRPVRVDAPLFYDQAPPVRAPRFARAYHSPTVKDVRPAASTPRVWAEGAEPTTPLYDGRMSTACATSFPVNITSVMSASGLSSPSIASSPEPFRSGASPPPRLRWEASWGWDEKAPRVDVQPMSRPAAVKAASIGAQSEALGPGSPLGTAPLYGKPPGSPPKQFIISPRPGQRQINSLCSNGAHSRSLPSLSVSPSGSPPKATLAS